MSFGECKECGEWLNYPQNYCPGCGRRLPTYLELGYKSHKELMEKMDIWTKV